MAMPSHTKTKEYRAWAHLIQRTTNPKNAAAKNYSERGIKVCQRWRTFANFLADMGPKPSPAHTIERIHNDGDYEPGNCKWATRKEQCNNSRNNRRITFEGKSLTLTEWSKIVGVTAGTLHTRLKTWPLKRCLTEPRGNKGALHHNAKLDARKVRRIRAEHATGTIGCVLLARRFGVNAQTILDIINRKCWKHV